MVVVSGFTVLPCWRFRMVAVLIRKLFPQRLYRGTTCHVLVLCVISRFLGSFEDHPGLQEQVAQFSVAPHSLQIATASTRVRVKSNGGRTMFRTQHFSFGPWRLGKTPAPAQTGPREQSGGSICDRPRKAHQCRPIRCQQQHRRLPVLLEGDMARSPSAPSRASHQSHT